MTGKSVEALARASAPRSVASSAQPRRCPRSVGHHATADRPRNFYIQLVQHDLYMLIIPTYFKPYLKGRPYPQLVVVQACEECEWVIHANRNKDQIVLDKE